MPTDHPAPKARRRNVLLWLLAAVAVLRVAAFLIPEPKRPIRHDGFPYLLRAKFTNELSPEVSISLHALRLPEPLRDRLKPSGPGSNIAPGDYLGPEACRECHADKFNDWSLHAHRRMNALADAENVVGDFTGLSINYLGGTGHFYRKDDVPHMAFGRDGRTNEYRIVRTIGSRFFQRYTGVRTDLKHEEYGDEHLNEVVLPFSYWIAKREWVPTIHMFPEVESDDSTWDPYEADLDAAYDLTCAECHTTIPYGDLILRPRGLQNLSAYAPRQVSLLFRDYLATAHPQYAEQLNQPDPQIELMTAHREVISYSIRENAVALGITCEACHYGGREHVENSTRTNSTVLPRFFPHGPQFYVADADDPLTFARTTANKNFMCARCHTGGRPTFANGLHTWNSTEYTEALAGACYNPLRATGSRQRHLACTDCHDPHQAIGQKWTIPESQNDRTCIKCHLQFNSQSALTAHTHHAAGSEGSHCLNCHMPKFNEGMQDMVRTHRIFSPTDPVMIEANQPNACNMCHVEQPINWTLRHLKEWYGREYDTNRIARANPDSEKLPAALSWLKNQHGPTRLVASDVLCKARARWALPELVEVLDDKYLANRQFTQQWLEEWLEVDLRELGYRFYMTPAERKEPMRRIRAALLRELAGDSAPQPRQAAGATPDRIAVR